MSSSDVAVSIRGLGKAYTIRQANERHTTVAEALVERMKHPLRRPATETFWALRDVDLEVKTGEVVGVIGRNGAGKSTLLKLLSRITAPTEGEISLLGRVGSLLEVGTGFHPELTGRENIFLNGAVLGMRRSEIARRFDQIVEFAGIDRFLDTPVKRYSSGMYVRLAFSVAAHLDRDILLVDEVLAVGDGSFQRKCLGAMQEAAHDGRAIIFVSHDLRAIGSLCDRVVLLEAGGVSADGEANAVVTSYLRANPGNRPSHIDVDRQLSLDSVAVLNSETPPGATTSLHCTLRATGPTGPVRMSIQVLTHDGQSVGSAFSEFFEPPRAGEAEEVVVEIPSDLLAPGSYYCHVGVGIGDHTSWPENIDLVLETGHFQVLPYRDADGVPTKWDEAWGPVHLPTPTVKLLRTSAAPETYR